MYFFVHGEYAAISSYASISVQVKTLTKEPVLETPEFFFFN